MSQTLRERGEFPGYWVAEEGPGQEAGADDREWESEMEEPQAKKGPGFERGASFGPPRPTLDGLLKAFGENQDTLRQVFIQSSAEYTRELRELKEIEWQRLAVDQQRLAMEQQKVDVERRKADALERLVDGLLLLNL
jgi:hypothetical protein